MFQTFIDRLAVLLHLREDDSDDEESSADDNYPMW